MVVHEAALSGCYLLLSKGIGARADFAVEGNSFLFNPLSVEEMESAFSAVADHSEHELNVAQTKSLELSRAFGLDRFVVSVVAMCRE